MKAIKFITSILLKNKIKDNFFHTVIVFSLFFAFLLYLSSLIFIGDKNKLFIDTGIAGINLILLLTSIYFASECLPDLKKQKFINWLLSLPVNKSQLFIGIFSYLAVLITIIFLIYTSVYLIFFFILKIKIYKTLIFYLVLLLVKFILLSIIGIVISIKYNSFSTMISLFSIYFIGSSTYNLILYLNEKGHEKMIGIAKIIYFIFPDFNIPNLTARILHFYKIDISLILKSLFYYLIYTIIILIIGCLCIEKKDIL